MNIISEGHSYKLSNFENPNNPGQIINFIHKEALNPELPVLTTINDGTTNEEVLDMLINRMYYLQNKFPCRENSIVITKLEESLMWLNKRTQDRIKRNVEGQNSL